MALIAAKLGVALIARLFVVRLSSYRRKKDKNNFLKLKTMDIALIIVILLMFSIGFLAGYQEGQAQQKIRTFKKTKKNGHEKVQ